MSSGKFLHTGITETGTGSEAREMPDPDTTKSLEFGPEFTKN
jgi:hypothetical protein